MEKEQLVPSEVKGLGIVTASIFLAGEMAGSGVLALPSAIVGTGWSGLLLILFFSGNAAYIGSRLGLCWEILAESGFEELQCQSHVRDPYPLIAEKAGSIKGPLVGKAFRLIASVCIIATLYGSTCVFMILVSNFLFDLTGGTLNHCLWTVIVATAVCPFTWFGTPKDFWPIAVGALLTTMTGCVLASIQIREDVTSNMTIINCSHLNTSYNASNFQADLPAPTAEGYFKAFGSIMFAFGGASTFPTIQADMTDKSKFKMAAALSMALLFLIYFPTAAVAYFSLGNCVNENVIMSMSDGGLKTAAECVVLLHLISALPIVINPPSQFFEELLQIPKEFSWKRCVFRTVVVAFLLFIAVSVPSFGSILDLIGGSTITILTFILPPLLYMIVMDHSQIRQLAMHERVYCWFLIFVGLIGGVSATYTAIKNIVAGAALVPPCYVKLT